MVVEFLLTHQKTHRYIGKSIEIIYSCCTYRRIRIVTCNNYTQQLNSTFNMQVEEHGQGSHIIHIRIEVGIKNYLYGKACLFFSEHEMKKSINNNSPGNNL